MKQYATEAQRHRAIKSEISDLQFEIRILCTSASLWRNRADKRTAMSNETNHKKFHVEVGSRISRLPPYLFGRINKMKYEMRVNGIDIIDLGMGNPTDPTPPDVVKKLQEAAIDPRNH